MKSRAKLRARPAPAAAPTLSVVVPAYNEAEILRTTYRELTLAMSRLGESYEIVFVNDGSSDNSRAVLATIAAEDARVTVVNLARNFGHELATTAGLKHCQGKAAVILDADLQDPPEVIQVFLQKWREGFDVVYGVRRRREGETWLKKATSFCFYRLMQVISDVPIPRDTGDFRLMDRRVVEVFNQLSENPRFFRGMISWIGFKQTGVYFDRRPRVGGVSKYRYHRLVRLAFDTITSFSMFPAQAFLGIAGVVTALVVLFSLLSLSLWAAGSLQLSWSVVAQLGLLWVGTLNLAVVAVLGQYALRTHRNTQARPLFTVDSVVKHGKEKRQANTDARAA